MRGYRTMSGYYYESDEGPHATTDREVPVQPSPRHHWDDVQSKWIGSREEDNDDLTKMRLRIKDVLTLGSVLVSLVGLYYGLTNKIELQGERFASAIQGLKDTETLQTNAINGQIDDIKHRLEIHEERTTK